MKKLLLLLIIVFVPAAMLFAQQPFDGTVILKDGQVLHGRITYMQGHYPEVYKVQTTGNTQYIFRSQIESIGEKKKSVAEKPTLSTQRPRKSPAKVETGKMTKNKVLPSAIEKGSIFAGYVELMNICNFNGKALYQALYSTGGNLSFGKEWNDKLYVGGGISCYYVEYEKECGYRDGYWDDYQDRYVEEYHYYYDNFSAYSMDFFADVRYKFIKNKVTPVAGLKIGVGFNTWQQKFNYVTRPSLGLLFRLKKHNELMLNVEYVPAGCYNLNGISFNLGYKFGK